MRILLSLLICLTGMAAQATTLKCTGSAEEYDVTLVFNFDKNGDVFNMTANKSMDEYDTMCDTPASCPVRDNYLRTITAKSLNYEFSSCNFNAEKGLVHCWNSKKLSQMKVRKEIMTALNYNGEVYELTNYKMELISEQLKSESEDLMYPWALEGNSLTLDFDSCQVQ